MKLTWSKQFSNIAKYLLVAAVIAFISLLFPNRTFSKYDYKVGQLWQHEDLFAPFDFAIKKTDDEIKNEKEAIRSNIAPYYLFDENVSATQVPLILSEIGNYLDSKIDTINAPLPRFDKETVLQETEVLVNSMYTVGFLENETGIIQGNIENGIQIVKGNIAKPKPLSSIETKKGNLTKLSAFLSAKTGDNTVDNMDNISGQLLPNINYSDSLTSKFINTALSGISDSKGLVKKGEKIAEKGRMVNDQTFQRILSFEQQYAQQQGSTQSNLAIFLGYLLLTSLILGVFLLYLQFNAPEIYGWFPRLLFMMFWLVLFSYLVYVIDAQESLSAYMIPFCIVPIVVKNFYNERLALFTHIVVILIASFLSKLGYEFTFLQILTGIVAVLVVKETRYWSTFFSAIVIIFVTYVLGYFGLTIIQEGSLTNLEYTNYTWLLISAVLTSLAYPSIPLFGKIFGFTSSISLAELTDMNKPLLKRLSFEAPGTFQHSLQVANLSEAAAEKIGAKSLMVKTAALYHDIGKLSDPGYFIENQSGSNPHDELSYMESAAKIISHVTEGIKMAKKAKLPREIVDFIATHHGTTRVEYFYRKFIEVNPHETGNDLDFKYPGPRPRSKEEAILMIADSLEAASKSLKNPTGQDIDKLVDGIIAFKINNDQLSDSDLSFKELQACTEVFKQTLRSIHHVRIEYPEEAENSQSANGEQQSVTFNDSGKHMAKSNIKVLEDIDDKPEIKIVGKKNPPTDSEEEGI